MDDKDDIDDEDDDKPRSSSDFFGQSSLVTRTGSLSGFQQMAFSSITPKAVLLRFSFPARTSLSSSTRGRQGTFEDSDEDLMAPTPLPPPPSVKAMSEGKGHRKSEETVRDLEMEIEKLQARLEKKRLLEKSEQIASTSESDSTQGQRSDNSVQGQRPDNRECETVPKVERSNSNEVGEELGKATEKAKDSRKDVVIENNINVPLKSADKGDVPISKLLKKDSYSKTTFNQEHFLNSVLSGPPPSAKKDSRGRGALGVPPEAKITGASAKDVHRSPKQIADGVNNDLVGERESLYWKGMGSNPDSGWDAMEEGVFENQFLEVESDVLEITLPPNPNIPHTKATRTGDYVKTEETNSGSSSVKTSDFKSSSVDGFQNESISGETLSVNEHTPDSQNQSGYSDDSMGPPNLPPLKYPDHPPSSSFTSEDSSHSTQLPPKRKSQEMKTSSADGSTLKSELDEKDISDYQEFNNSSRSNYSKVPQTADNNAFHTVSSYTTYMASLQSLADHHGYVIKDVTPDGNCMFSAIVDQLRIQGNFDLTPNSLRKTAVEFLRDNPKNQDGTHLESYLSTETWDEYLTRMGQDSQWGDHMVLQACTEVTGQRIVVFKPNSNKTELVPTDDKSSENSSLTLGHIGESHFVSLRPKDWESSWPLMAHAHRAKMKEKQKLERKKLRKMKKSKKQKQTSESTLPKKEDPKSSDETETEKGAELTEGATQEDEAEKEPEKDEDDNSDEDEAESDDSQFKTTDDLELVAVDRFCCDETGSDVPMPHLSFIIRYLLRPCYFTDNPDYSHLQISVASTRVAIVGGATGRLSGILHDYNDKLNTIEDLLPIMVGITDGVVVYDEANLGTTMMDLTLDLRNCHPGYCRLVPNNPRSWERSGIKWSDQGVPWLQHPQMDLPFPDKVAARVASGFQCNGLPADAMEWVTRERKTLWPCPSVIEAVVQCSCIVVSIPHANSSIKDIEWLFVFNAAEECLITSLSVAQKYCFRVFKALVDASTKQLSMRIKTVHMKSVMFYALEQISATRWEDNLGGCIMYLISKLESHISQKCLPNYFISGNNMIDHYSDDALSVLAQRLQTIRLFPIPTLVFLAESHGIHQTFMLTPVVEDISTFKRDKDFERTIKKAFVPSVILLAKSYLRSDNAMVGQMFQMAFKESQCSEKDGTCSSFKDFVLEILAKESDMVRYALAKVLNEQCNLGISASIGSSRELPVVKDILDQNYNGPAANVPIDRSILHCTLSQMKILDNLAYGFYMSGKASDAATLLGYGIAKTDTAKKEIIDVSDIENPDLKADMLRTNAKKTAEVNKQYQLMNQHLWMCRMIRPMK